uniref:Uncharacterized protein n=1 Tax=Piliocolobus tephrosceles TaxID=591936 RepID=A0A8C9LL78_9PRIM
MAEYYSIINKEFRIFVLGPLTQCSVRCYRFHWQATIIGPPYSLYQEMYAHSEVMYVS